MDADSVVTAPPLPAPAPSGRRWNADRIVSLTAIAIGLFSLFVTVYQTYLTRQAQSASVLPYLAFGVTSNDDGAYVTLRNDGVGPARIEAFRIHYKGQARDIDPFEFYLAMKPDTRAGLSVDKVTPGRLLPANSTIQMCGGGGGDRLLVLAEMLKLFALADAPRSWLISLGAAGTEKAVMEVEYSSVYGDRWRLRSNQLVPQPF
ncbi:MAG: hypothetical protein ABIT71_18775 [Vicinamibacteraceae bacterium]